VKANFLALMRAIDRGWPLPLASIRNRRSLVYVGNLVDAIIRCLDGPAQEKTYVVSDGAPVSTPELCRAIARALGRPARLFAFPPALLGPVPGMARLVQSQEADDAAIRADLGWRPPFGFEEGLRRTAEWYRAQGG
jgi:nucleoside-diphosphate-sugar epimerase